MSKFFVSRRFSRSRVVSIGSVLAVLAAGAYLTVDSRLLSTIAFAQKPEAADSKQLIINSPEPAVQNVITTSDDTDTVYLNSGPISSASAQNASMRMGSIELTGRRLQIVKFDGPIQPEWRDGLIKSGLEIVDYIPQYSYLVYGEANALNSLYSAKSQMAAAVSWNAEYLPEAKIQPGVFSADASGKATLAADRFAIQMYRDGSGNVESLNTLNARKLDANITTDDVLRFTNVIVRLDAAGVAAAAELPDVISIHPYLEPVLHDERQNRLVTGFTAGNAVAPGNHLSYLASRGFTQEQFDASNFIVNVSDDGLDAGVDAANTLNPTSHFALYRSGDPSGTSRVAYIRRTGTATVADSQGCGGHGNLNTHIVGGFVPDGGVFSEFPHADSRGQRYGMGVAPFARLGSSVVFSAAGNFTGPDYEDLESTNYQAGARISTNSWGANVGGAYNADAQRYDALVRDAQPVGSTVSVPGNQEYVMFFSAGNRGSAANTTGSPGTAKNVITVGGSENVHAFGGTDGCGVGDGGANNLNDIISFSSRGPTDDQRVKPELVAPGTHITGGVAQASLLGSVSGDGSSLTCFVADGVCGGAGISNFFPGSQQWYTASSGTSHSTPAVAGGAALIRQFFLNQSLTAPSPAMTKAVLLNSTVYLNGVGANDNLYSNSQGMGMMDLDRAFNAVANANLRRDQLDADRMTASGQQREFTFTVADGSRPVRATLAWTDAAGSTTGNSYVNNLDLEVVAGEGTYLGNVFTGNTSRTGGTADVRNNVETVIVPAGTLAPGSTVTVRVKATNIAGDGVPGNADALDQDFALIVSSTPIGPTPNALIENNDVTIVSESGLPTNGIPDPGESLTISLPLQNVGTAATGGAVTATLLAGTGYSLVVGSRNYGTLAASTTASRDFSFTVSPGLACGDSITLTFSVVPGNGQPFKVTKTLATGVALQTGSENFDGVTAPALPAGWTTAATGSGVAWVTSTESPSSAPNAAFAPDPSSVSTSDLETPGLNISTAATRVEFKINYDTEAGAELYDGAVLDIKIGSGDYQDILAAGGSFSAGGYVGTISSSFGNPLGGRQGWGGNSGGYIAAAVQLPAGASGQQIKLRWRLASDSSESDVGVRIDDIVIFDGRACATPAASVSVGGFVLSPGGISVRNARVVMTDSLGNQASDFTDNFGEYSFPNVIPGRLYTLTVASKRYVFTAKQFVINTEQVGLNFTGQQ